MVTLEYIHNRCFFTSYCQAQRAWDSLVYPEVGLGRATRTIPAS